MSRSALAVNVVSLTKMSRKHMVALVGTVILAVSLAVLISEAFDRHDTQPFPLDPEVPTFLLGSLLGVCLGTAALAVRLLSIFVFQFERLWVRALQSLLTPVASWQNFEQKRLLFSPPPCVSSLRI